MLDWEFQQGKGPPPAWLPARRRRRSGLRRRIAIASSIAADRDDVVAGPSRQRHELPVRRSQGISVHFEDGFQFGHLKVQVFVGEFDQNNVRGRRRIVVSRHAGLMFVIRGRSRHDDDDDGIAK